MNTSLHTGNGVAHLGMFLYVKINILLSFVGDKSCHNLRKKISLATSDLYYKEMTVFLMLLSS